MEYAVNALFMAFVYHRFWHILDQRQAILIVDNVLALKNTVVLLGRLIFSYLITWEISFEKPEFVSTRLNCITLRVAVEGSSWG